MISLDFIADFSDDTSGNIEFGQKFHERCEDGNPLFGLVGGTDVNVESWIDFLDDIEFPAEVVIKAFKSGWSVVATNNDGVPEDCRQGQSGKIKTVEFEFEIFFKAGLGIGVKGVEVGVDEDLVRLGKMKEGRTINCCCEE